MLNSFLRHAALDCHALAVRHAELDCHALAVRHAELVSASAAVCLSDPEINSG
jgi:hypothetical protein